MPYIIPNIMYLYYYYYYNCQVVSTWLQKDKKNYDLCATIYLINVTDRRTNDRMIAYPYYVLINNNEYAGDRVTSSREIFRSIIYIFLVLPPP